MTEKSQLQSNINTYLLRREKFKSDNPGWLKCPKARARVKKLNKKLKVWKWQVTRLSVRNEKIWELANEVAEFMEVPTLRHTGKRTEKEYMQARMIFYKYAIESGIEGSMLCDFMGTKFTDTASKSRLRFTRSFKTNPGNCDLWKRFRHFLQNKQREQNEKR